ncbi:alpha/beta hydrolase [Hespellia stercorisuis]|uniref:Serine aminopeptidase S33 domain-containing protein n=1 Tax=Hespellia stercorisuis DSM 15480 TaxID=1121950 RepID=A0A1M6NN25_9FIRM|nr:alpha/beta hydrolase [Hespellia stercorisuis]SHJ97157.1 hypothetical protein SAMN02745243_01854 [Hespellia stercorisuis DSM 15480]
MKNIRKILKTTGIVLGAGLVTCAVASNAFYNIGLKRQRPKKNGKSKKQQEPDAYEEIIEQSREWFGDQNPEVVSIESFDGLDLAGYYLACEDAKRTVICVHGYRGSGIRDFAYIARFYHEHQCNVLLIDQRGHGASEGEYVDLGVKARFDCVKWAEYVVELTGPGLPIYLDGVSMGAATVLMAGGLELPESVRGIIADCGYTSPWDEAKHACKTHFHLPAYPTVFLLNLQCRLRAGYSLREASPIEAMEKCKIPILFVHGEDDDFVPPEMSRLNYEAYAGEKQIEIVPHAKHAVSYMVDTERCNQVLLEFFEKHDQ